MIQQEINQSLFARKLSVVIGLGAMGAIHILDLPGKWQEVRYIGIMYVAVVIACVVIAERILMKGTREDYLAAAALFGAVLVGYVVNRTVGMPGAKEDIGNWLEPLGFISVFIEVWSMFQAIVCLRLAINSNKE